MFKLILQLHGGKGSSTTNVQSYTPTAEEIRLQKQAADYSEAVAPNALRLNNTARDLLWDSLGSNQVDYKTLNSNAQRQIANATSGLNNMIGTNTSATNTANSTIGNLANQFTTGANNTNSALGSYANQYGSAANTANSALNSYGTQYGNAANTANSTLGSINPQYTSAANSTNAQLAGLANGTLPSQYQTNMENAIRSALTNTMGNTVNSLGNRGVLNSSVTNSAMNDISKNAADTVAQQYQNNINIVGNLAQQQLGNTNTALGAQREIAQQQLGNTNTALEAQSALAQQRLGNTNNALGAQSELAQQQLGNTNNALEARLNAAQSQLSNTMNTNQANAGLLGSLIDSASTPITVAAAGQEAAQQPALNLWNASLGLNSGGTLGALNAASGKGTTTSTQTTSGGSWLSGVGGVLGGLASGWASTWCFAADTLIAMADGTAKHIQDVVKGDKVLCPHIDNTETEEEVLEVMEPHFADVYAVTAKDMDGNFRTVLTTSSQPLLCADGTYVTVGNMKLMKVLHGGFVVQSIEYDQFCKVYDLKVSGKNNYYADGFAAKGGTDEW